MLPYSGQRYCLNLYDIPNSNKLGKLPCLHAYLSSMDVYDAYGHDREKLHHLKKMAGAATAYDPTFGLDYALNLLG